MKEELLFCPLGGSGEIGMNMNLYAYGKPDDQKWIIVDVGVTFADDSLPGIDLIYPDPGFIIDKKDKLLGIILTHAHEDHIGAIAYVWPKLKCKIYATPFTAALITEKFKEKKIDIIPFLEIVSLNGTVNLDPFKIEFVTLTHSILEPNGLKIETPAGNIFHTGDWKCDPNPLVGEKVNSEAENNPIADDIFFIVPNKCTECVGFHEEPQCAAVCPVDCCIPDENNVETEDQLLTKQKFMHD